MKTHLQNRILLRPEFFRESFSESRDDNLLVQPKVTTSLLINGCAVADLIPYPRG